MLHRHLNHSDWTLAAIDDVIARGRLDDWKELRDVPRPTRTFVSGSFEWPNLTCLIRTNSDITSGIYMSESNLPDCELASHRPRDLITSPSTSGFALSRSRCG